MSGGESFLITISGDSNDSNLILASTSGSINTTNGVSEASFNNLILNFDTSHNALVLDISNLQANFTLKTNFNTLVEKFNNLLNVLTLGDLSGVLDIPLTDLSYS